MHMPLHEAIVKRQTVRRFLDTPISVTQRDALIEAAALAHARGKTIVVTKIGGSEKSRRAALAHTGALAGNLVGRALDEQERRRLAEATQRAFVADTNQPTTYTVEPTSRQASASGGVSATNTPTGSAQPTVVSARPVGPAAKRTDGSTCRPIEMTATKNGQTTTETTTFCQAAGSNDLKPLQV